MPRFLELFAGAGGMTMGFEAAGWECVGHAEIEPHARAVLRYKWPEVPLHGDVAQLDGTTLPHFDLLTFGAPCQDLSIAGKRAGMTEGSGTRSSLFFEAIRIWKESSAPLALYENVLGAYSSNNGKDFAAVLSAFVGAAVPVPADGWRGAGVAAGPAGIAAWRTVDLQHFGWDGDTTPQRRRRVFVLGTRTGAFDPAEVLLVADGLLGNLAAGAETGAGFASDAGRGIAPTLDAGEWRGPNRNQGGVIAVGNHADAWQNGGVLTYDARGNGEGAIANTLSGDHQNRVTDYTALVLRSQVQGVDKQQGIGFSDTSPTLKTDLAHQMGPVVSVAMRNREGKPGGGKGPLVSAERSLTLGTSNDQVVFTKRANFTFGDGEGIASSLMARDAASLQGDIIVPKGNEYVMASGQANAEITHGISPVLTTIAEKPITFETGIPRRLMPIECERLMGWPDHHTAMGTDEQGRDYALSDTARYKLCGNGVGSPVTAWIGMRLKVVLDKRNPSPHIPSTP
jgi:DNA (cytosine-5)-methyltransferase 1